MALTGEAVILIIIIAIILIGLLLFLMFALFRGSPITTTTPSQERGFMEPCSSVNPCINGLICEGICLKSPGTSCNAASECAMGAICDGVCVLGPTGDLGQPCPCSTPDLTCVTFTESGIDRSICKIDFNQPCNNDSDCATNKCQGGLCAAGRLIGQSCSDQNVCNPGLLCSNGFCQESPFVTGENGAFCSISLGPGCNRGLVCIMNTCVVATQTIGQRCDTLSLCQPPLICDGATATGSGVCIFPDNPNICVSGECLPDNTCVSGTCQGQKNQPCFMSNQCVTGFCDINQMSIFIFNDGKWNLLTNNPQGVIFERLQIRNGSIWGLDLSSGVYAFINSRWSNVLQVMDDADPEYPEGSVSVIKDFSINRVSGNIYVLCNIMFGSTITNTTVYTVTLATDGSGVLIPFNTTDSSFPGVQFRDNDTEIRAVELDVSDESDILLLDDSNTVQIKMNTFYSPGVSDVIKPRFYTGRGDALMNYADIRHLSNNVGEVIEYQGSNQGLAFPLQTANVQREYEIVDYETHSNSTVHNGQLWIIAEIVFPNVGGTFALFRVMKSLQTQFPGYFNEMTRIAVDSSGPYIQSIGVCG